MNKLHPISSSAIALTVFLWIGGCASFQISSSTGFKDPETFGPAFLSHFDNFQSPEEAALDIFSHPNPTALPKQPSERARFEQAPVPQDVVIGRELSLGMSQEDVLRRWGTPDSIGIAQKDSGNERWTYPDDFAPENQNKGFLYFENGNLVGWELPHGN